MAASRILIVANKSWEAGPLVGVLHSSTTPARTQHRNSAGLRPRPRTARRATNIPTPGQATRQEEAGAPCRSSGAGVQGRGRGVTVQFPVNFEQEPGQRVTA